MKTKLIAAFISSAFLFNSCGSITPISEATAPPVTAPTLAPIPTATLSPLAITPENAKAVVELKQWGRGNAYSIRWSPNGDKLAVASSLGLYIFDAETLEQIRLIETPHQTHSVSFSPDGKNIIAGGCERFRSDVYDCATTWMELYSVDTGKNTIHFGNNQRNGDLIFSQSGKIGASNYCSFNAGAGVGCRETSISIWDTKEGKFIRNLTQRDRMLGNPAFSPDDLIVFTTSGEFSLGFTNEKSNDDVIFWNVVTGEQIKTLAASVLQSYDEFLKQEKDQRYKTGWYNEIIKRYIMERDFSRQIDHKNALYNTVAYYRPLDLMARAVTAGKEYRIEIWDMSSVSRVYEWLSPDYVLALSFSPDGKYLAGLMSTGIVGWEIATSHVVRQTNWARSIPIFASGLSLDGDWIVAGQSERSIYILNALTQKTVMSFEIPSDKNIRNAVFNPNGTFLATADSLDETIYLWDLTSGKTPYKLSNPRGVTSFSFSHNGRYLVSANAGGELRLWDLLHPQDIRQSKIFGGQIGGLDNVFFSLDDRLIFSSGWDGALRVWDSRTGSLIYTLKGFNSELSILSPNGYTLVGVNPSVNMDTIRFVDLSLIISSDAKEMWLPFSFEELEHRDALAFNQNGRLLVWTEGHIGENGKIVLWDMNERKILHSLIGHNEDIFFIAFSPDNRYLLSFSADGTTRLWGLK